MYYEVQKYVNRRAQSTHPVRSVSITPIFQQFFFKNVLQSYFYLQLTSRLRYLFIPFTFAKDLQIPPAFFNNVFSNNLISSVPSHWLLSAFLLFNQSMVPNISVTYCTLLKSSN